METKAFRELFQRFNTANKETLELLLTEAVEHKYPKNRTVLMEDAWGNAIYFVVSGWVKVRRLSGEGFLTLAILGKGDFFGEMAILDESPRSTDVIALSNVRLLSVSAQRFIQTLFKDPQLHHRILQLMVRRVRQSNIRFQLRNQPPAVKLAKTLIFLAQSYGQKTEQGTEILTIPYQDLADVSDIRIEETQKIIETLQTKGWVEIDLDNSLFRILHLKQLTHLAGRGV